MNINQLFNETELTIFHRQANFTFGNIYQSLDKHTILSIDKISSQLFSGSDLIKRNLHPFNSISSVELEGINIVHISFSDSQDLIFETRDAEKIVYELTSYVNGEHFEDVETLMTILLKTTAVSKG